MSDLELVDYAVQDRVAEITMQREPVNAINMQLTREVNAAYRMAKDDPEVRAIILTSGPASQRVVSEWRPPARAERLSNA